MLVTMAIFTETTILLINIEILTEPYTQGASTISRYKHSPWLPPLQVWMILLLCCIHLRVPLLSSYARKAATHISCWSLPWSSVWSSICICVFNMPINHTPVVKRIEHCGQWFVRCVNMLRYLQGWVLILVCSVY